MQMRGRRAGGAASRGEGAWFYPTHPQSARMDGAPGNLLSVWIRRGERGCATTLSRKKRASRMGHTVGGGWTVYPWRDALQDLQTREARALEEVARDLERGFARAQIDGPAPLC